LYSFCIQVGLFLNVVDFMYTLYEMKMFDLW